jgi:hypothetical protein
LAAVVVDPWTAVVVGADGAAGAALVVEIVADLDPPQAAASVATAAARTAVRARMVWPFVSRARVYDTWWGQGSRRRPTAPPRIGPLPSSGTMEP